MTEWLKNNAVGLAVIIIILSGFLIGYGHSKAGIDRLATIEERQIEILERLSHLEGRFYARSDE